MCFLPSQLYRKKERGKKGKKRKKGGADLLFIESQFSGCSPVGEKKRERKKKKRGRERGRGERLRTEISPAQI